jgi:hypothetical protein
MTNFRKLPKNNLICEIKSIHKAIRFKCFDCMAGGKRFDCKSNNCPLFPFRPWAGKEPGPAKFQKQ